MSLVCSLCGEEDRWWRGIARYSGGIRGADACPGCNYIRRTDEDNELNDLSHPSNVRTRRGVERYLRAKRNFDARRDTEGET